MAILLISDLHLDESRPYLTAILLDFLAGRARQADAVYLLGDVFEAWIGDDDRSPFNTCIEQALKAVVEAGVPVYFMHGNRDFMIAKAFAARTGVQLLDDPSVVVLGGIRTLLTHGDRYCTADHVYQAFRARSRTPQWQRRMLWLPLFVRRWIARNGRRKSAKHKAAGRATPMISDVVDTAVAHEMQSLDVSRLIHGHTHRPAVHLLNLPRGQSERIVLADWREEGEALEVRADGSYVRIPLRAGD
jgi:UDP-2,3-diacylglucosamine hydrolase